MILLCLAALGACGDMIENIRSYLDKGETIYVGKVDSLHTLLGYNRIMLVGYLPYGMNQASYSITVTDPEGVNQVYENSVSRVNLTDTLEILFEDLKEGQYSFDITMYDRYGNSSLTVTTDGYAYGDFYQSTLLNRRIERVEKIEEGVRITWRAMEGALYTEVSYLNKEEKLISVEVENKENSTVIEDYKPGSLFTWRSAYVPVKLSVLDIFYATTGEMYFPE